MPLEQNLAASKADLSPKEVKEEENNRNREYLSPEGNPAIVQLTERRVYIKSPKTLHFLSQIEFHCSRTNLSLAEILVLKFNDDHFEVTLSRAGMLANSSPNPLKFEPRVATCDCNVDDVLFIHFTSHKTDGINLLASHRRS